MALTTLGKTGIIADDLTGAGDTALQWISQGESWIMPWPVDEVRAPSGAVALTVNADYRHELPLQAARRVDRAATWLQRAGCSRFYLKIDSTLRGHPGLGVMQALQSLNLDLAIVAPAFPQAGRITVGGYQLVNGVPVGASPYAKDPLAPSTASFLPRMLVGGAANWADQVEVVGLDEVMRGPEGVVAGIVRALAQRKRILVVDAARWEDLQAIARAMAMTPYKLLPVGSAGLAKALQPAPVLDVGSHPGNGVRLLAGNGPPVLIVAGSPNPTTRDQVAALGDRATAVVVDPRGLLLTEGSERERAILRARGLLAARQDVALVLDVARAPGQSTDDVPWALGRDLGMTPHQVAAQLDLALAAIVARLATETPLAGLVLAGGATAQAACEALGLGAIRVVGPMLPAIPLCTTEVAGNPLRVVTKSGGFGAPTALADILERLRRSSA